MYFQLFTFIVSLALISNFNLLKHHNCVGRILDTPAPPSSHDPTMGGSGAVLSNFIYDVGLCHSTHTHIYLCLSKTLCLTVLAVHCGSDHLHLISVLHLLPPETSEVLHFDEVTLVLLQGKPCSINEPLTPHHRNAVLLCRTS